MKATAPRWSRIAVFLALVFSLSWGSALVFEGDSVPPLGMFVPALVAVGLRVFLFRDSPIHRETYREPPVWVLRGFVLLFLVQVAVALLAVASRIPGAVLEGIATWSMIGWTLAFIKLYRSEGERSFARAGLQLGNTDVGLRLALGVVLFLVLQGALDLGSGLGENLMGSGPELFVSLVMFALSIVGTPLGGLALFFGEEYGFRGFLQDELEPLGRRAAALIIGLIWGIWHIPILLGGVHTYPPTPRGFLLAAAFFVLWGFFQSYAVLKTGGIWTAAVLHGVVNGLYSFLRTSVVRPDDKIFSFGLGLYGVVGLALVALCISRDPVWRPGIQRGEKRWLQEWQPGSWSGLR